MTTRSTVEAFWVCFPVCYSQCKILTVLSCPDCKCSEGCILRRDKSPWFSVFIKYGFLFTATDRNTGLMDLHRTWQ